MAVWRRHSEAVADFPPASRNRRRPHADERDGVAGGIAAVAIMARREDGKVRPSARSIPVRRASDRRPDAVASDGEV